MAHNSGNFCRKKGYCEFARYCVKVPSRMREKLAEERKKTSAIEDAVFISKGSGRQCQEKGGMGSV